MKTKIQIKSISGKLLFEFKKEDNCIKNTVIEAIRQGANLYGANLSGANLRDAYLSGANLRFADLRFADLRDANLRDANLYGANLSDTDLSDTDLSDTDLRDANLRDANLSGANLSGADLYGANLSDTDLSDTDLRDTDLRDANLSGIKIKRAIVFTGLYKYIVIPFISDDNEKYIKMGCYTRKLSEWKSDFWNNDNEFPNNGSEMSNLRLFACETAERWFDVIDLKQKP